MSLPHPYGASPGAVKALMRMNSEIDISHILPAIRVPTLILHRTEDTAVAVEGSHYMAECIPGAKYVELTGRDHVPMLGDADAILDEIEESLTGTRLGAETDRALLTVLFTDIVGSTERAAELGDRRWRDLLDSHRMVMRLGARVAASARPGEVLVSSTVKDLVAGSGLQFQDRGTRTLKGIPDEWRLFAVVS